jgi:hypothetical protein
MAETPGQPARSRQQGTVKGKESRGKSWLDSCIGIALGARIR